MGKKEEQICPNEKWKPELCILTEGLKKWKMIICLMINRHYKLRYWYSLYFQPNHTEQSSVELSQFQSAEDWSWLELYDQYVIDFDIDFKSH